MKRHIIIHYHLFKNAGSTVDFVLARHFKEKWLTYDIPNRTIGSLRPSELAEFVASKPHIQAISTHLAKLSPPNTNDCCYHPLVFLRHPLDRIGSVYTYLRRLPDHDRRQPVLMAKSHDLADFVRWRLDQRFGANIRNFQTSMLCNDHINLTYKRATAEDLKAAKDTISDLAYFGLVEHFDASIEEMRGYLQPYFGEIDTHYQIQNKSPDRSPHLNQRLDELLQSLGSSVYDELESANRLDLELYDFAETLFMSRKTSN